MKYSVPLFVWIACILAMSGNLFAKGTPLLQDVENSIMSNYNGDRITRLQLIEGAARGMVEALNENERKSDKESKTFNEFIDTEDYKRLQESVTGKFAGIGAVITKDEGYDKVLVKRVLPGSPALRDGLKDGDLITAIDGQNVKDLTLSEAVSLIRGRSRTTLTLHVERKRNGKVTKKVIPVRRGSVVIPAVATRILDNTIGAVQMLTFSDKSPMLVSKALGRLRAKGIDKLILDLRNNPGGEFSATIKVADLFLEKGTKIVTTSVKGKKKHYFAQRLPLWKGKIICLVNQNSASAAEILAGALKTAGVAIIAGENTFGKNSVQTVFNIQNKFGLKLTTRKMHILGTNEKGSIEPDILLAENACKGESWISMTESTQETYDSGILSAKAILMAGNR